MSERTDTDGNPGAATVPRRTFLDLLLAAAGLAFVGGAAYPVGRFLWPPTSQGAGGGTEPVRIPLAEVPVGKSKVVRFRGKPTIVVHKDYGVFALSAACTHLGCLVIWDDANDRLLCPCHAATFDLRGNVTGGPAPQPLASYTVKVVGDAIVLEG